MAEKRKPKVNILVIPTDISEEELEQRAREIAEATPKPKRRPKGWAAMWETPHPADDYDPPPLLTGDEIRQYRESKGWYLRHLGDRTGYSPKTIRYMETGASKVSEPLSMMIHMMQENDRLREEVEQLESAAPMRRQRGA